MSEAGRTYVAIDLKSFYASVECVDRGLDPLTTNLVVADVSRTEKTICLAVSPSGVDTMGKLARMSVQNEETLYKLFGVNAELLIDHAWGWEPCTMEAVKAYRPETNSFSSGQVLQEPYDFKKARVVIQEMAEGMALGLVSKRLVTDQLVLTVGYDAGNAVEDKTTFW